MTQKKIYDEAFDYPLAVLKLIFDWFVRSKMMIAFFTALYADNNIYYFGEDSGEATFYCKGIGILDIDPNNISLDDKLDEDYSDTIIVMKRFGLAF